MQIFLFWFINGGLLGTLILIACLHTSGREIVTFGRARPRVKRHKRYAYITLMLTVAVVAAVKYKVYLRGGLYATDLLFWSHLATAITFCIGLAVLVFWKTGEKSRSHKLIAYPTIVASIIMAITGFFLNLR